MRNLKKFLALVLAMMMTLSLMVTVNAAKPVDFSDKDKITAVYKEAVDVLSALKVVKGDNGFRPGEPITRAEVAAIVYRIVTGDVEDKNVHLYEGTGYFTDVATGKWYDGYVNYCANNGLVQGVGGGKFEPSEKVTGYQALVMILRAIGYNNPKEFSDSDWKLKASGYGRRLGITKNIAEGSLGGYATREVIAEIMYRGLLTPTVKYTMLEDYQPIVAGQVNGADRYEDLLLRVFDTVHKSSNVKRDNYGNPSYQWLYWSKSGVSVEIPIDPVDTFYTAIDECELVEKLNSGDDIDVDYEFLNGRSVERANTNAKGEIIGTRTLDALHTTDDFVGAQGRETKVYHYSTTAGTDFWDIVYVDTYLGVVRAKTPVTLDTNGHVMHKATLSIEVGEYDNSDAAHPYAMLTSNSNFDAYNVGDVVLLKTWSPSAMSNTTASVAAKDNGGDKFTLYLDWTGLADADALTYDRLTTKASARPALDDIAAAGLASVKVTVKEADNTDVDLAGNEVYTIAYTGSAYPKGTYTVTVAADPADGATITFDDGAAVGADAIPFASHDFDTDKFAVVSKATDKTVTITGTTGAADDKTGIITSDGTYLANVVYHVHNHDTKGSGHVHTANQDTPTTVADLYDEIFNSLITKSYKLYLDAKGNILGMEPVSAPQVGVVLEIKENVEVGTNKEAVQADIFMEDGSTITALFLNPGDRQYFGQGAGLAADVGLAQNDIVKLVSYTKDGKTFYEQVDDGNNNVDVTTAVTAGTVKSTGAANKLVPGVANTLDAGTNVDLVNDDTVFFVFYTDFQYNLEHNSNTGDQTDRTVKIFRGFKNVPVITGNTNTVKYQMLDNDSKYVVIYADGANGGDYTGDKYVISGKDTVTVDDSYLIVKCIATYEKYAEYKVMHNGVEETLKVANSNTGVNTDVERAMTTGQLIEIAGRNLDGVATQVKFVEDSNVKMGYKHVSYNDKSVLTLGEGAITYDGDVATDRTNWAADGGSEKTPLAAGVANNRYWTLATNVKVMIVNRDRGTIYEGTTGSINQYAAYGNTGHAFAWELDANGYISTLYVLD